MEGDEVSHLDPQDGPWSISVLNCFDMCRCSCGCSSPARCVHQQKCSDSFTWVRGVLMRGWRAWSGQGRMWALTSTLASSLGTTPLASHGSSPMRTGFGGPPKSSPMRTGDCPALFAEGYTSPPHRERERESECEWASEYKGPSDHWSGSEVLGPRGGPMFRCRTCRRTHHPGRAWKRRAWCSGRAWQVLGVLFSLAGC